MPLRGPVAPAQRVGMRARVGTKSWHVRAGGRGFGLKEQQQDRGEARGRIQTTRKRVESLVAERNLMRSQNE